MSSQALRVMVEALPRIDPRSNATDTATVKRMYPVRVAGPKGIGSPKGKPRSRPSATARMTIPSAVTARNRLEPMTAWVGEPK